VPTNSEYSRKLESTYRGTNQVSKGGGGGGSSHVTPPHQHTNVSGEETPIS
jgi:hypothetical protein